MEAEVEKVALLDKGEGWTHTEKDESEDAHKEKEKIGEEEEEEEEEEAEDDAEDEEEESDLMSDEAKVRNLPFSIYCLKFFP